MEAHDDGEMARPVPLDNDDTHVPSEAVRARGTKTQIRGRPWLPMLLAGGSIVLHLRVVAVLGALEFERPPRRRAPIALIPTEQPRVQSRRTISDAPPTLEESLPGLTDRLTS